MCLISIKVKSFAKVYSNHQKVKYENQVPIRQSLINLKSNTKALNVTSQRTHM